MPFSIASKSKNIYNYQMDLIIALLYLPVIQILSALQVLIQKNYFPRNIISRAYIILIATTFLAIILFLTDLPIVAVRLSIPLLILGTLTIQISLLTSLKRLGYQLIFNLIISAVQLSFLFYVIASSNILKHSILNY